MGSTSTGLPDARRSGRPARLLSSATKSRAGWLREQVNYVGRGSRTHAGRERSACALVCLRAAYNGETNGGQRPSPATYQFTNTTVSPPGGLFRVGRHAVVASRFAHLGEKDRLCGLLETDLDAGEGTPSPPPRTRVSCDRTRGTRGATGAALAVAARDGWGQGGASPRLWLAASQVRAGRHRWSRSGVPRRASGPWSRLGRVTSKTLGSSVSLALVLGKRERRGRRRKSDTTCATSPSCTSLPAAVTAPRTGTARRAADGARTSSNQATRSPRRSCIPPSGQSPRLAVTSAPSVTSAAAPARSHCPAGR